MRILFVNSVRDGGGGVTSAFELATGLAARGHAITIAVNPDSALHKRFAGQDAVRVARLRLRAELNPARALQLASLLRRVKPQLILADRRKDVKFCVAAQLLPGAERVPLVHRHGAPSTLKDSPAYRFVWRRVRRVVVNSSAMRAALLAGTPWLADIGVRVVHNGKDTRHYRPRPELRDEVRAAFGLPFDAFVLCYHGELQARKNLDVLLESLALVNAGERVVALIAGSGPALEGLRSTAAELRLNVRWAGRQSDIPRVLAAADAAVHLSSAEGFSNAVLEAMACGLPVIASHATSHPEQIGDGEHGLLVPPREARAVAHAIQHLRDHPAERARMGVRARERVIAEFSLERMLEGYETVFEELLTP